MADEDDRLSGGPHLLERLEALLLEVGVADGERLVEQEDVERHLDRDRVGQPKQHPRRVVLELLVDEALEPGELEDRVEARATWRRVIPISIPLISMFVRAVNSGLKPTPSSMNGDSRPRIRTVPVSAR